jgi:hypothetical protein
MRQRHVWTDDELQALRQHYAGTQTNTLARRLGLSAEQVYRQASRLGLKKSEDFMASDRSGRIKRGRVDPRMIASQFKAGLVPWNKGTNWVAGGRSVETRFKPGRKPEEARNYMPIGTTRMTKDGYLERKVTDDPKLVPARRWVAVHRLVWEAANGPVPDGHMVIFKPGMRTTVEADITPDRLECISRADNARRNHPRTKSPELARLVQLKGAITRQVNRITRESQTKGKS